MGFLIFAIGIFLIGRQQNLFNPVFKLTTNFNNISGLRAGNNVRFSGIDVGTINTITIVNDTTIQIDMLIKRSVREFIKTDSEAAIGSEGIIGDRVVIISQGNSDSQSIREGQVIPSVEPVEMDDIISSLYVTARHTEVITAQLAEIMTNINMGDGTLGRLIHDTDVADNIDRTIINFRNASKSVEENMDSFMLNLNNNMETVMASLQKTTENFVMTSNQITQLVETINQGSGTLGMLIQDTTMSENLARMIYHLKESSVGLDENMKAAQSSFFLKGYFRKKAREAEKLKQDSIQQVKEEKMYLFE